MRNPIKAGILCAALLSFYASAWAALGEGEASVAVDQEAMNASRRVSDAPQYALHEIQLNSGTLVREYVSAKGIVFAVAWQGPFLPDLKQLLGQYFDAYTEAARNAPAGRGPIRIDGPEL
ncbi:MAG: DUF2844 domain-containing protein, partial [Candidatus Accumulibacter sp.]|nr:DUF2844 domain-containing protein [Accumulibacter sp.]